MAFGRVSRDRDLLSLVTCAAVMLTGCNSSGDSMGASGGGGSTGAAASTEPDTGTGDTPGPTTGGDETSGPGGEASGGSSSEAPGECEEDQDCDRGSQCLSGPAGNYCCYAIAWDGSCCESGQCFSPDSCGPDQDSDAQCDANEVCEDGSCIDAAVIEACDDPDLSPISLPVPGLGDPVALLLAETDGTAGAELVTLSGATVTIADAIETGIPTTTAVTVPGKADLVDGVAADLDADGLDELLVVDAEGTVTVLHALGSSTYGAIQAIGSSLRPPLKIADLDAVIGPELIGISDDGYTAYSVEGLVLDNVGASAPKGVSTSFDLTTGSLLTATDLAVSDDDGVILVSSPAGDTLRVDDEGTAQRVAIEDLDGDGLGDLSIALPRAEDMVVKSWSPEALAAEDGQAQRWTLPLVVGAQGWGDIDGDAASEWIVASPTDVEVVHFGAMPCRQVLAAELETELMAVGDVDADGVDEVVVRGAGGFVLLDISVD